MDDERGEQELVALGKRVAIKPSEDFCRWRSRRRRRRRRRRQRAFGRRAVGAARPVRADLAGAFTAAEMHLACGGALKAARTGGLN